MHRAKWRIYASVNKVIIDSNNGLSPLSEPMLTYSQLDPWEQSLEKIWIKVKKNPFKKIHVKISSAKWRALYFDLSAFTAYHAAAGEYVFASPENTAISALSTSYRPELTNELWNGLITMEPYRPTGSEWDQFAQDVIDEFQEPEWDVMPHLDANAPIHDVPVYAGIHTKTKMSFWRNCRHWLHRKLSNWQLSVQPVTNISSKW